MLETLRKYWIGLLVLVLVGLHASIVGIIRHQASLAKIDASCEVDLGNYVAYQLEKKSPMEMRLHAIVPLNHRMKSRQLIELNQAQIRQSIEEYLRQLDGKCLVDPYLSDLKSQLMEVMIQTIGDSSIDDLVITEVRQSINAANIEFISQGKDHQPRRLVATLRGQSEAADESDAHGASTHAEGDHAAEADESGHENSGHASENTAHGTPEKKPAAAHGAPDKKPAAAHGAAKKPEAKPAGGHGAGADKKKAAKKSGH
jgi:hypothetical protein